MHGPLAHKFSVICSMHSMHHSLFDWNWIPAHRDSGQKAGVDSSWKTLLSFTLHMN